MLPLIISLFSLWSNTSSSFISMQKDWKVRERPAEILWFLRFTIIQNSLKRGTFMLVHSLVHLLAVLAHLLARHCSLCPPALLRSLICSLALKLVGQWNFFSQFTVCAFAWLFFKMRVITGNVYQTHVLVSIRGDIHLSDPSRCSLFALFTLFTLCVIQFLFWPMLLLHASTIMQLSCDTQ